jgi:Uma2 family endonuclease
MLQSSPSADYNAPMSTRPTDYVDAIQHLPDGAALIFHDVTWDEYVQVLQDLHNHRRLRATYDCGRLEIVSPLSQHENYARFIDRLLQMLSDELYLTIQAYGSTTWKRKALERGAEADSCFYIQNADRVIGKANIDLESDPPPDVVLEVDLTNESSRKFAIYAALLVPEIWHYNGTAVRFFVLSSGSYVEVSASRSIPVLRPEMLMAALEINKKEGQTAAVRAFRSHLGDGSKTSK